MSADSRVPIVIVPPVVASPMIRSLMRRLLWRSSPQIKLSSPALNDGWFEGRHGRRLYHSRFNTLWLAELGINPKVIVDVGSYDGGDAFRFHTAFPKCRVIAIEAEPLRYAIVNEALSTTPVEVLNVAVSDRDGEADWYRATADGKVDAQGSLYLQTDRMDRKHPHVRQAKEPMRIPTARLDTLCRSIGVEQIDLLHMDIQGAEHVALQGLDELRPTMIFLEVKDDGWIGVASSVEIHHWLASRGYQLAADLRGDRLYFRRHDRL